MSTLVRAGLAALAIVLAGAAILVIGYFYRAPVPEGYAFPRHNWWGGGLGVAFPWGPSVGETSPSGCP